MSTILTLTDARLTIGTATLLDHISLSIDAGERIALIGPNGAGKSSLLRILSGELRPSRGDVSLFGRPLSGYAPAELAERRAVLSQQIAVAFPFRVAEIVAMGGRGTLIPDAIINDALGRVGLTGLADRIVTTLSGGEQQRAHIARVLVQMTFGERSDTRGLIFLDEPTASLDLRHQLDLAKIVSGCAERGLAVVSILHDLNLVPLFADRVIALNHGRIADDGPVDATITESMMRRIFNVAGAVGRTPPDRMPFVLPQSAD
ncbi:MAG: heme ABC transporter ATP-binding protein [Pseudolabrys sp.]|nr:heme ABC transporter ATP-binding protein [Pseudolabrys sp.]